MIPDFVANAISRLVRDSTAHNTLDARVLEVFFNKSPGWPEGDQRGIGQLDYQMIVDGAVVASGTTGDDGRILMPIVGGQAELRLAFQGTQVAAYQFNLRDDSLEADTTISGIQRRLRLLGYHLGHTGDAQDGIDGDLGGKTDKAILDFQIDKQLAIDGVVGAQTRSNLNNVVGGSAKT